MVAAAGECPQPGDKHNERERLAQVVVGSRVESLGLVMLAVLGRQHEDWRPDTFTTQSLGDQVTIESGQQQVEHDGVVPALARPPEPVDAIVLGVHGETFGDQPTGDRLRQTHLVLDQQHAHRSSMGWLSVSMLRNGVGAWAEAPALSAAGELPTLASSPTV